MFFSLVTFCAFTVPLYQQALCWGDAENIDRSQTEKNVEWYPENKFERILKILNSKSTSTPSSQVTFADYETQNKKDLYGNGWKDFPTQPADFYSVWGMIQNGENFQSILNNLKNKPTIKVITPSVSYFSSRRRFGLKILRYVVYIALFLLGVGIATVIKKCRNRKARAVGSDKVAVPLTTV